MSITVRRRVRGLHKGSKKRLEVLEEGIVGVRDAYNYSISYISYDYYII